MANLLLPSPLGMVVEPSFDNTLIEKHPSIWTTFGEMVFDDHDNPAIGKTGLSSTINPSTKREVQEHNLSSLRSPKLLSTQKWTLEWFERECRIQHLNEIVHLLKQALQLFDRQSFRADSATYATLLKSCSDAQVLSEGKLVHQHIIKSGCERDRFLCNLLVEMYGKCGALQEARAVFDKLNEPNVFSWTIIIAAYAQNGQCTEALQLFRQMQENGVKPNKHTFSTVLSICSCPAALPQGIDIHANAIQDGFESDVVIGTALVHMYGKCESVNNARIVFEKIRQHDVVSWNAMIAVYVQRKQGRDALLLFQRMQENGVKANKITFVSVLGGCNSPDCLAQGKIIHAKVVACGFASDIVVGNALIDMYGNCGNVDDAKSVFDSMYSRDLVSWTSMIGACSQHGNSQLALELYEQMQCAGLRPNEITFVNVLTACANVGALAQGKVVHDNIIKAGFVSDVVVGTALVNMYGKCGSLTDARLVFDQMHGRDTVLWNAMVAIYAQHGHGEAALELLSQMQHEGVMLDEITFLNTLRACSRAGLVEKGCQYFVSMIEDYNIIPTIEHCGCMVDIFGRAGLLKEAEDFINNMPFKPSAAVWESFLGACRTHADVERGQLAAQQVMELDPQTAVPYALLAKMYASVGRWDDVEKVRKKMIDRGVKKPPGSSSIEIKDKVHEFVVRDRSHAQTEEIYAELERLSSQMEMAGYMPDVKPLLHDIGEDAKEHFVSHHSEKLALAFGLINTPSKTPLRIITNLRMCTDCHAATKFISKIVEREITVRDMSRFHQFRDGLCSCGDYW